MLEFLHTLNGCLVVPVSIAMAIFLLIQRRRGHGLTPLSFAAALIVSLLIFSQVYMGISLLGNRGQRSMLHYTLGVLPLLLLLVLFWLPPQTRTRPGLSAGIGFSIMAVIATAA
jgi:hypothetical protein